MALTTNCRPTTAVRRALATGVTSVSVDTLIAARVQGGSFVAGWPGARRCASCCGVALTTSAMVTKANLPGTSFVAAPLARDIDGDGANELLFASQRGQLVPSSPASMKWR